MKRLLVSLLLAVPMMVNAGSVKSPNGNVELTFSVDPDGRPVYEMSYKGRAVVKPSFLGLALAKDKPASMGLKEHDLMAGFKNIAGGEIKSYTEMLTEGRAIAEQRMVAQAQALGADAIVCARFSSASVMEGALDMLAYGTAVKFV